MRQQVDGSKWQPGLSIILHDFVIMWHCNRMQRTEWFTLISWIFNTRITLALSRNQGLSLLKVHISSCCFWQFSYHVKWHIPSFQHLHCNYLTSFKGHKNSMSSKRSSVIPGSILVTLLASITLLNYQWNNRFAWKPSKRTQVLKLMQFIFN